jgi:hypothetical protein
MRSFDIMKHHHKGKLSHYSLEVFIAKCSGTWLLCFLRYHLKFECETKAMDMCVVVEIKCSRLIVCYIEDTNLFTSSTCLFTWIADFLLGLNATVGTVTLCSPFCTSSGHFSMSWTVYSGLTWPYYQHWLGPPHHVEEQTGVRSLARLLHCT